MKHEDFWQEILPPGTPAPPGAFAATLPDERRIALVDDVISTGRSILAGISLLETCGVSPVVVGTAMLQAERWWESCKTTSWKQCYTSPAALNARLPGI